MRSHMTCGQHRSVTTDRGLGRWALSRKKLPQCTAGLDNVTQLHVCTHIMVYIIHCTAHKVHVEDFWNSLCMLFVSWGRKNLQSCKMQKRRLFVNLDDITKDNNLIFICMNGIQLHIINYAIMCVFSTKEVCLQWKCSKSSTMWVIWFV